MDKTNIDVDFVSNTLEKYQYKYCSVIGKGASATVIKVWSEKYHQYFAAKLFSLFNNSLMNFSTEINSLKQLLHPNIISIYAHFVDSKYFYVILDYCQRGCLSDHENIEEFKNNYLVYTKSLISAIAYCHSKNICHSDIKPGNILVDANGKLKVADFGLSYKNDSVLINQQSSNESGSDGSSNLPNNLGRTKSFNIRRKVGTKYFVAPEVIMKNSYDPIKADVYSLGVTLYVLLTDKVPTIARNSTNMINRNRSHTNILRNTNNSSLLCPNATCNGSSAQNSAITNSLDNLGNISVNYEEDWENLVNVVDSKYIDLLKEMIQEDPMKRPDLQELLERDVMKLLSTLPSLPSKNNLTKISVRGKNKLFLSVQQGSLKVNQTMRRSLISVNETRKYNVSGVNMLKNGSNNDKNSNGNSGNIGNSGTNINGGNNNVNNNGNSNVNNNGNSNVNNNGNNGTILKKNEGCISLANQTKRQGSFVNLAPAANRRISLTTLTPNLK